MRSEKWSTRFEYYLYEVIFYLESIQVRTWIERRIENGARRRFAGQFFLPSRDSFDSSFRIFKSQLDLRNSILTFLLSNDQGIPVSRGDWTTTTTLELVRERWELAVRYFTSTLLRALMIYWYASVSFSSSSFDQWNCVRKFIDKKEKKNKVAERSLDHGFSIWRERKEKLASLEKRRT